MLRFSFTVLAVSAALTCLAAAAEPSTVQVQGVAPTPSGSYQTLGQIVRFNDLDPTNASGASKLLERINAAAGQVCSGMVGSNTSRNLAERVERCRKDAVRKAVAKVGSPALTQAASAAP